MLVHRILFDCQLVVKLLFLFFGQLKLEKSFWTIMGKINTNSFWVASKLIRFFLCFLCFVFLSRYHHSHEGLESRQKQLLLQYKFKCQCEPCQKNYPPFVELQEADIPTLLTKTDINKIIELDKKFARQNFSRFCTYLNKYSKHYPCQQISSVEECLKMCLLILVNNIPLKLKYKWFEINSVRFIAIKNKFINEYEEKKTIKRSTAICIFISFHLYCEKLTHFL